MLLLAMATKTVDQLVDEGKSKSAIESFLELLLKNSISFICTKVPFIATNAWVLYIVSGLLGLLFKKVIIPGALMVGANISYSIVDAEAVKQAAKLNTAQTHEEIVDAFTNLD